MSTREVKTSCRICAGACSLRLTLNEQNRIIAARGDKENPVTLGYACIKGLHLHDAHDSPERLLHPLKRMADGTFQRIPLEQALDEIAERLQDIMARHGAEAVAGFRGTLSYSNQTINTMLPDWLTSLGSNSFFSTMTIDQSAKWVTFERLGGWAGGKDAYADADVLMFVGTNPLVSLSTFNFALQNPVKQMHAARERGMKLIVIDPRESETARHADVFLQPYPGEDSTIMAGLLRMILAEGWHDADFCARYVKDLDKLQQAVEPFTPEYVAHRAGVPVAKLIEAATVFARPDVGGISGTSGRRKRGTAASGTGPNMAQHSNLAEHLMECLNVVCGRFARPGDKVPNPGVIGARYPRYAQVIAPRRSWESGWKSRVGNYGMLFGQKMTGVLPEEITTPGAGQIRALFVDAGNPVSAIPDQNKVVDAFRQLELLVTIDPFMTNTAKLSHYILPPRMMFEHSDLPTRDYESFVMFQPYAQYAQAVVEPPPGSEVVEDWYVFWALAKRLGKTVVFDGVPLDMQTPPSNDDLLAILMRNSPVSFDEVRSHPEGKIFDVPAMLVEPGDPASTARFDVIPDDVEAEIAALFAEDGSNNVGGYTHRLAVRRLRDVQNTMYHHLPVIRHRMTYNPAFVHSADLAEQGLNSGDSVRIISQHGAIPAIVRADDSLRAGVVSMPHGWGGLPGEGAEYTEHGSNPNLLISTRNLDPINAMPQMSAIPVRIERLSLEL